jgi:hypothetical protein
VVQYAHRINSIKGSPDGGEFQNVGLRVFDVLQSLLARPSPRISEVCPAEVDCENARVRKIMCKPKWMLTGATSRNEDILIWPRLTAPDRPSMPLHVAGNRG